jgi:hypothetical protein
MLGQKNVFEDEDDDEDDYEEPAVRQVSQCPQLDFAPTELAPFVASPAIKIWLLRSCFSTALQTQK